MECPEAGDAGAGGGRVSGRGQRGVLDGGGEGDGGREGGECGRGWGGEGLGGEGVGVGGVRWGGGGGGRAVEGQTRGGTKGLRPVGADVSDGPCSEMLPYRGDAAFLSGC